MTMMAIMMTTTMMMIMMIISQGMSVRSVGKIYNVGRRRLDTDKDGNHDDDNDDNLAVWSVGKIYNEMEDVCF